MKSNGNYLPALDSLRGMAALSVCLFHSNNLFGLPSLLPHAYIAVDFFFVLSGFILFYRYGHILDRRSSAPVTVNEYIIRRLARLYPLLLLATLAGFLMMSARLVMSGGIGNDAGMLVYALISGVFMLPAINTGLIFGPDVLFPFVGPAWSVFWEMVVSIGFALWARAGLRFVPLVTVIALLSLAVFAFPLGTIDGGWRFETFHIGGLRAVAGFCLGILIARLYARTENSMSPKQQRAASLAVFALICLVATYIASGAQVTSLVFELLLLAIVFPTVVFLSAHAAPCFLVNKVGFVLGSASYSLYLLHIISRDIAAFILGRTDVVKPSLLVGSGWLLATIFASYLCWRFFETPARRWLIAQWNLRLVRPASSFS